MVRLRIMDSHDLDPLVLEFELISLRRDLQRILSGRCAGKKKQDFGLLLTNAN
jgi:hypothetical protein